MARFAIAALLAWQATAASAEASRTISLGAEAWRHGAPAALYALFEAQANATSDVLGYADEYPTNGGAVTKAGFMPWQTASAHSNWVCAFYPAILWKLANRSLSMGDAAGAAWWVAQGNAYNAHLIANENNTGTHDVGFMTVPAFGQQLALTGNASAAAILAGTAASLAYRFDAVVGAFESWGPLHPADHRFEVIVDNMLNLELPLLVHSLFGNATCVWGGGSRAHLGSALLVGVGKHADPLPILLSPGQLRALPCALPTRCP